LPSGSLRGKVAEKSQYYYVLLSAENGYEVAGLQQPLVISDDDEALAENVDQFVTQNMYSGAHKYRSEQELVRALTLVRSASLCLSGGPCSHSKSTSTPFCVRLHWRRKRL